MGDNLAQLLYEAFRKAATDPSSLLSWGNLPSTERETWEAVATKARELMALRFVADIDRALEGDDSTSAIVEHLRSRWSR